MIYDLKNPCRECPFRKTSLKGYLGPDTGNPEAFIRPVMGSRELAPGIWVGGEPADIACHMDVDAQAKRHGCDPDELEGNHLRHCAGALHFLVTSCKQPHDRVKCAAMDQVKPTEPMLKNYHEFIAHHTLSNAKAKKRATASK